MTFTTIREELKDSRISFVKGDICNEEPKYQAILTTDLANINYDLITYVQDRLGHDARYAIDPTKIVIELGWYRETPFTEGIEKIIRWYLDNQG